jgi:hypothetical protein
MFCDAFRAAQRAVADRLCLAWSRSPFSPTLLFFFLDHTIHNWVFSQMLRRHIFDEGQRPELEGKLRGRTDGQQAA